MPINPFEDFPMSWKPNKDDLKTPMYQSIAEILEKDVLEGSIAPNTKLPPQRELADFLDISLNTVTRAYTLLERRGIVHAVTGSGTFVSPGAGAYRSVVEELEAEHCIDMSLIEPFKQLNDDVLEAARRVINDFGAARLFEYRYPTGYPKHKLAAKQWIFTCSGLQVNPEDILVVSGTQNGLAIVLASLFQAGERIAVDAYTYPNLIELAKMLHIQLVPIKADGFGLRPDSLEEQCRLNKVRGVYVMPSCSNPTCAAMPEARRKELAEIIKKQDMLVIEDDVYDFIAAEPVCSFCELLPEQTLYLSTLSKSVSGGLRVSYLYPPKQYLSAMTSGIFSLNLKTPSLNAEIAAELILSSEAKEIMKKKLALSQERNLLMERYFPATAGHPLSFFRWLELPESLQGYDGAKLEQAAIDAGVRVYHSNRFQVGAPSSKNHIRVSLCTPTTAQELESGLKKLSGLFLADAGASSRFMI